MATLTAAHVGYEYQDLLVAVRLVDVVMGAVAEAIVDEKLVDDDRFDDLTCIDADQNRVRSQFKHTENDDRPLTLATFTNDGRGLRLDRLIACMLDDRAGPGSAATSTTYRLVLRDRVPDDVRLTTLLKPAAPDPGPSVEYLGTRRLQFDADALSTAIDNDTGIFSSVRARLPGLERADLDWVCQQLVIELESPPATLDLTRPGAAEEILLRRVRADVGAESFPNSGRAAIDVAAAFVSAARAARQGRLSITPAELLRRAQMRSDFGAVKRSDPVDENTRVSRTATVDVLFEGAAATAGAGGCLLITGPPGQGKSWVCQQLLEKMADEGWLVAEHYCFLGDADGERLERVLTEHLLGSLLARLASDDPSLIDGQRPRYAVDEDALASCVARAIDRDPTRPVALVIDGLDHITRMRPQGRTSFDPSLSVAETLASLELPEGCVLIVLSQPGQHLAPLLQRSPLAHTMPELDAHELRELAQRHSVIPSEDGQPSRVSEPLLEDEASVIEFLGALGDRSSGNALYATYLCREALRTDPVTAVRRLPHFDGTLENYYNHLQQALGGDSGWVAEVVAVAGFGISRTELREIIPELQHRVDPALDILAPVLVERASRGGIRIYHESFGRFLRQTFLSAPDALVALLGRVTSWLDAKGLFLDPRAYRSLLPLLAEAERHDCVLELVGHDFVEQSIAAMFPASAIKANLAVAIRSAAAQSMWPTIARYVEMSRAAESCESERYDSILVEFADVHLALLGSAAVADRMVHDGRLTVPARAGIQMCAAIDRAGGVAPWAEYVHGYRQEAENDNTLYGESSDRAVSIALARGTLRLARARVSDDANNSTVPSDEPPPAQVNRPSDDDRLDAPINWSGLAEWLDDEPLAMPDVAAAILETHGPSGLDAVLASIDDRGALYVVIAEMVASGEASAEIGSANEWAAAAIDAGDGLRFADRLLALGMDVGSLGPGPVSDDRARLFDLTLEVQEPRVQWENGILDAWINSCSIFARRDSAALDLADGLIVGDGWYRCWLRFIIALSRAEASNEQQSDLAVKAIDRLTDDLRPFVGDPRACDLYSIHGTIARSIRRGVRLLRGDDWIEGIRVLKRVSDEISTSLSGEIGGPVPIDLVLELVATAHAPEQHELASALIESELEHGSAGRFYSDLASYHLYAARLAIRAGDLMAAANAWRQACRFLSGYGWHKDITIYELLDPLGVLITEDPRRGRSRVADVQGLCERVPLHTDRDETRGAWGHWWKLLASADPVALARIVAPRLLAQCNQPNWLLYDALEELWRAAATKADPVVAGVLRLSLETPLEPGDAVALERLLGTAEANEPVLRHLMVMLMARADERPMSNTVTNSADLLATDDAHVEDLNAIATRASIPRSAALRDQPSADTRRSESRESPSTRLLDGIGSTLVTFPPGAPGLSRAIRSWRNRPYDISAAEWSTERFAATIGYRLVELAQGGRADEAESALHTLADFIDYGDRSGLLRAVAEGLERHGLYRLSAVAFALAWTRTRGHGGWLSFGGETELASLQKASDLDRDATLSVVADEVERFVASDRHGTYGISQALVFALARGALKVDDPLTTAFATWDEARSAIERRAPMVHPSDIPASPYTPPADDPGGEIVGDLDEALALATVAGMAHPSRERKRRTLAALNALLTLRPTHGTSALATALAQQCDPATLCWLSSLALRRDADRDEVAEAIKDALVSLAVSDHLTVRATARRLLGPAVPELPVSAAPHPAFLRYQDTDLWAPIDSDDGPDSSDKRIVAIVTDVAGTRLGNGEDELPGLKQAVISRVTETMRTEQFQELMGEQVRSFVDEHRERWPDAYLVNEQTVEQALQSVASGGRAAMMIAGRPPSDPAAWEDALGSLLLDDPAIPLILETTRQCRPSLPPVHPPQSTWWTDIRSDSGAVCVQLDDELLAATVSLEPASNACRVEGGQFDGWFWIATYEARRFEHQDFRRHDILLGERHRVVELRRGGDTTALHLPPVAAGDLRMWRAVVDRDLVPELSSSQPLVGLDRRIRAVGDGHRGLGVPTAVLSPTATLIAALALQPCDDIGFQDDAGLGLGLVTWRTDYDVSDYHLPVANNTGCGIVIRPDLFRVLLDQLGSHLVIRDFVTAESAFGAPPEKDEEPSEWQPS